MAGSVVMPGVRLCPSDDIHMQGQILCELCPGQRWNRIHLLMAINLIRLIPDKYINGHHLRFIDFHNSMDQLFSTILETLLHQ